jgi:hypothetical protein
MNVIVIAFFSGLAVRDFTKLACGRFLEWKFSREFEFSQEAFAGCLHDKGAVKVDVGVPAIKCLACWGLSYAEGGPFPPNEWHPNSAAPPGVPQPFWPRSRKIQKITEKS